MNALAGRTLTAFVAVAIIAAWLASAAPGQSTLPIHLRVLFSADATNSAVVSWSTTEPAETGRLRFRQRGQAGEWQTAYADRIESFPNASLTLYHARLDNLEAATEYELIADSGGDESPLRWFRTALADGRPIRLLAGGDSRSGISHRRKMNALIRRLANESEQGAGPRVVALAHGGDFVNKGAKASQWRQWLDDFELTTAANGQLLPLIPTRGNHDFGPLFDKIFDLPAGGGDYYATQVTPSVCLITLNTETSTAGDQRAWLADELPLRRGANRWLTCQYHKPAFPAVKVPSGALQNWVPLFEQHNVDLCLESDGHCIKRTPPLRENRVDPTGVVYIGEGGLGVGQRTPKADRWYLQPPGLAGSGHHVQLLTIADDRLRCQVILEDGSVFDDFSLAPRKLASDEAGEP